MKLLLDTHLLLWAAAGPSKRLSKQARLLLSDLRNELFFSAASIWELAIKGSLGRKDLLVEPRKLRRGLLESEYIELPITSEHAVTIDLLPTLHKDPFDRILVAQALVEGITLVTADPEVAQYPGSILKV